MEVNFLFKQKTAYEMRISYWSSDVCSSDLTPGRRGRRGEDDARRAVLLLQGQAVAVRCSAGGLVRPTGCETGAGPERRRRQHLAAHREQRRNLGGRH